MATEADFQEKLQKGYTILSSNLQELYDKDLDQMQTNMSQLSLEQLQNDNGFDQAKLQDTMQKLCTILSHDATKLTLACKPPRKPQDAIKMVDEISNTLYRIIGFYYDIPTITGIQTYRKHYRGMVDGVLRGAISLLVSFMEQKQTLPFMLSTAALWETCQNASHSLPASNEQAVAYEWKSLMALLNDAKTEVSEMPTTNEKDSGIAEVDEFEQDDLLDMEVDPTVAKQCQNLVGLTCLLFQKIQKRCRFSDELLAYGQRVVEGVDEMVSKAYDLEPEDMVPVMAQFVTEANALIHLASSCATDQEKDAVWFKMCSEKLVKVIE